MSKNQELIDHLYRAQLSSYSTGAGAGRIVKENRVHIDMDTFNKLKDMNVLDSAVRVRMPYDLDVFLELMRFPDLVPDLIRNATNFPVVIVRDIIDEFLDNHIPMTGDYDMDKVRNTLFKQISFSSLFTSKMVKKLNFDENTKCSILQKLIDRGTYIYGCGSLCPKEYPRSPTADKVLYTLMRNVEYANTPNNNSVSFVGHEYILLYLLNQWKGLPQSLLERGLNLRRWSTGSRIAEHCILHLCDIYEEDKLLSEIFYSKHALSWIRGAAPKLSIESIIHVAKDGRLARVRAAAADELIKRGVCVSSAMVDAGMGSSSATENRVWKSISKRNIDSILNTGTTDDTDDSYIHSL